MAFAVTGGGGGKRKLRVVPSMNVTPLVDVVLVLLIIFMVITPMMVRQMALHVPRREEPAAAAAREDERDEGPSSIVLSVRREGVFLNKERVAAADLPARLEAVFSARREKLLFFDAADDVPYGRAVEILDVARGGGARHIAVLTEAIER